MILHPPSDRTTAKGKHARTMEVKRLDGKKFIRDRTSLVKLEIE